MNFQQSLDAFITASRQEELNNSDQLLLGELILKLETVKNKSLPLIFDIPGYKPFGIGSWRGIYAELAIFTDEMGSIQTGEEIETDYGYSYQVQEGFGKENPTVEEFIELLKKCIGSTFTGYKGGDFTMSKNTPISVCQENSLSSFKYNDETYLNTWIVDIKENDDNVVLITGREEE